jgi:Fic family protein
MTPRIENQEKYSDIITKIDKHYKTMCSMRPLSADAIKRYYNDFGIVSSYNSNAIEGNSFTYDETYLLLNDGIPTVTRTFREHEDIVGYKAGFDYLQKALQENKTIDNEFVQKLHSFVMRGEEIAGQYRQDQVYIGNAFAITYTPCPPEQVMDRMTVLMKRIQLDMQNYHNLSWQNSIDWYQLFHTLAKHHCEFEQIHPFMDGNGRTGRLLLSYEFLQIGLLPVDIRVAYRDRYYAALKNYDVKKHYSTNPNSKTDGMAKLLAESELRSMEVWNSVFVSSKMNKGTSVVSSNKNYSYIEREKDNDSVM